MNNFKVVNILDLMDIIGEEKIQKNISNFSCPVNPEIEAFIKKSAIEFAKRKVSITYFIIDEKERIAAIFTLMHKAVQISGNRLSSSVKKKLLRYVQIEGETGEMMLSAYLIGQFGKNYLYRDEIKLKGGQLMSSAFEILKHVQREIGGGVVYLECEEKPQLLSFYQNEENHFRIFGERFSEKENIRYIQLFRLF